MDFSTILLPILTSIMLFFSSQPTIPDYVSIQNGVPTIYLEGEFNFKMYYKIDSFLHKYKHSKAIRITMISPGGSMMILRAILNDFSRYDGRIHIHNPAYCYSACAMLAAYANRLEVAPQTEYLLHMPWFMDAGRPHKVLPGDPDPEIRQEAYKYIDFFMLRIRALMTKQEWSAMLQGNDVFIPGDIFKQRHQSAGNYQ